MEVAIPSQSLDFDFDFNSARSSPYPTAPSTPKRFGDFYCSAPTSPSHLSLFYRDFDALFQDEREIAAAVPFDWEDKPGIPKKSTGADDFEFDVFSEDWETASVAADELFDGGVIRPLKPPPRLHTAGKSPRSPMISQTKKLIQGAFSPRHRNSKRGINDADPFAIVDEVEPQRGRERGNTSTPKSSSRRAARSLSPLRDTQYPWEEEEHQKKQQQHALHDSKNNHPSDPSPLPAKGGICHKKWRLKDLFLFRSASEGRAADKDPLKKHTAAIRRSSFRANEGSGSKRRGRVSAHELHYTANRAVAEDLKKKTFLPYKQGILGRLAFNPAVHALANGFGFSRK